MEASRRGDGRRGRVEWFPFYAWINNAPGDVTRDLLWPGWGWRFLAVALSLCVLVAYAYKSAPDAVVTQRA